MSKARVANTSTSRSTPPDATGELVDMPEAIRYLKTTRPTFYRWLRSGMLTGMKVGRQWRFYRQDLDRFLKGQEPQIELTADITPLLEQLRQSLAAAGHPPGTLPVPADQRLATAAARIITLAVHSRASDIHIMPLRQREPGHTQSEAHVELRIDGAMQPVARFDCRLLQPLVDHFKRLACADPHEKTRPQDGRIQMSTSEDDPAPGPRHLDLRACFLPSALGETVTIRLLDASAIQIDLDALQLSDLNRGRLDRALKLRNGMVLFTGPIGSGKTTVLYSCMKELARTPVKIISVEDPVEYILERTIQVPVNERAGLTFPVALRAMLRSAPNVLMVGEVRDRDTAQAMVEASLTGHLVLSSLHTDDAVGALQRLVDIGVDAFLVADTVKFVMAQRLVRRVCPQCSRESTPGAKDLAKAAGIARQGGLDWDSLEKKFRATTGCPACAMTGYRGRTIIAEILEVTPGIARAVAQGLPWKEIRTLALQDGMIPMAGDGLRLVAEGTTTVEEVFRVLGGQLCERT